MGLTKPTVFPLALLASFVIGGLTRGQLFTVIVLHESRFSLKQLFFESF